MLGLNPGPNDRMHIAHKWDNGKCPIQIHAYNQVLMGPSRFFIGPLQVLICLRIISIKHEIWIAYI